MLYKAFSLKTVLQSSDQRYVEYQKSLEAKISPILGIGDCIIYYNTAILSDLLMHGDFSSDASRVAALSLVSPVAWQHISIHGRF